MLRIETGFIGERKIYVPQPLLGLIADDPLTGDLYIHSVGHISRAEFHGVSRPHGAKQCMFFYCAGGRGWVEMAGQRIMLSTHRYIAIPAGLPHGYHSDPTDPWTIYWVRFSGVKAAVYANGMSSLGYAPPAANSRIGERTGLFESIYDLLSDRLTLQKLSYANSILAHFLAAFLYHEHMDSAKPSSDHAGSMVNRTVHYMAENIENRLTLEQVATYAGYSKSYFYRKFVIMTGYGPMEYFTRMKIDKACYYLIKTDMSVVQIAAKLGFTSADYFSRTFKKIVGIPASEFRRQGFRL